MLELGRWWGSDSRTRTQEEIDIVASGEPKGSMIFAECKWTNEPVGEAVLEKLRSRSALFRCERPYWYLFAKRGFTEGCKAAARELGNVRLVPFSEMF